MRQYDRFKLPSGAVVVLIDMRGNEWECFYTEKLGSVTLTCRFLERFGKAI